MLKIVESVTIFNDNTGEIEDVAFEWSVDDNILLQKWEEVGYSRNGKAFKGYIHKLKYEKSN